MRHRNAYMLVAIIVLAVLVLAIVVPSSMPTNSGLTKLLFWQSAKTRDLSFKQGLDLQGGTQVLLEAKPAAGQTVTADDMNAAKTIVERRVNALGLSEPLVQSQGQNRIIVELPGIADPEAAVETLRSTGQLEFVEIPDGTTVQQGDYIRTTNNPNAPDPKKLGTERNPYPDKTFSTIMTGAELSTAGTQLDQLGSPVITFELKPDGAKTFATYTASHIGKVLAIVLDNQVLSAPSINSAIPEGRGEITGKFTLEEAQNLAVQMKYGALPVPLEVVSRSSIGATLGADSVRKSMVAGLIGLLAVLVFMMVYYRLPGFLASLALILYALINLAIYKVVPITLTLPGIMGFLLSTGMAVDANILIFERMKEEIRWGKSMRQAVEAGFDRAWTSILDSNLSTLIICGILIIFGRTFGAQPVLGFALNLGIGVLVSMFTAVVVTRSLMRFVFERTGADEMLHERQWLMGV
jgi:protein-export membrane protein SecD